MEELSSLREITYNIISKAYEVLKKYPLCDRCLGRLFARYGLGLDNKLRGEAIKVILSMILHKEVSTGKALADTLRTLSNNGGYPITNIGKLLINKGINVSKCYICNNELDTLIGDLAIKASKKLSELDVKTFLVGVKSGSQMELRENEIIEIMGIEDWESIRREIKREVGKAIQRILQIKPDFRDPDVLVIIDLDSKEVSIDIYPLYLLGRYLKLGRFISQMDWVLKDGKLKYDLSIERVCRSIANSLGSNDVVIHAAGREDVDVRMLGNGRPLVIEVKKPKTRYINYSEIALKATREFGDWIKIIIKGKVGPSTVTKIKEEIHQKNYLAITYVKDGISDEDIAKIKELFRNTVVKQLTPLRVLRRKKETLRVRKVYEVDGYRIDNHIASFLIRCDGGLYVKELINGDKGRTKPSFSEVIGKEMEVISLDVVYYLD